MKRPNAQHDLLDKSMPKSGVHDLDCKWVCKYEPGPPDFRGLCPRTDHAPCRLCGSK